MFDFNSVIQMADYNVQVLCIESRTMIPYTMNNTISVINVGMNSLELLVFFINSLFVCFIENRFD